MHECAEPFAHTVIDGFLKDAEGLTFPAADAEGWRVCGHRNVGDKLAMEHVGDMPPSIARTIKALNREPFLTKLSALCGIEDLLPDPYFFTRGCLFGGGLHLIRKGGFLNVHVDYNAHPTGLARRVNLLVYLSGGSDLELWGATVGKRVSPRFNRAVIFNTTEESWHGHPRPLEDDERRSIALYYYTATPLTVPEHSTIYR